jgi:acyl transferase domain-containing protein/NADPH:quinone reductase-like Zn-dependent oxidoreductase/acyl carrier protein
MKKNLGRRNGQEADSLNASTKNHTRKRKNQPVAIIGIGCRFPGANSPEEFWQMLQGGVDAIKEMPKDRFDIDLVYDPRPGTPGKVVTRKGGFLDNVDKFDAGFFGISPREALQMDPQQRLLLEVSWEALEDAGQPLDKLAGSRTGVFIGNCVGDYEDLAYQDAGNLSVYSAVGNFRCSLPGRISYMLDLRGPSLTIDAGCAASLAAVHIALQSVRNGECDLALAGGVNLILHPQLTISYCSAGMLSPDGYCKSFDASANGFVRGEAAAVVLLKPLSLALADGDPIYATILGSAVNEDGYGNGLFFAPSVEGHKAVLRDAYQNAGIAPNKIQYVETHGTGTRVGDPTEAEAIGTFFRQGRAARRPLAIGSVKSNMGHAEGGAGIAGLIKVALSLKHRELPPSLHVREPNPNIPWNELRLKVQRELSPWPVKPGEIARAGVSSLGISGTNSHVVLEEPPRQSSRQSAPRTPPRRQQLLVLSARSEEALRATAESYREFLIERSAANASLYDICHNASLRRTHHNYRLAVAAESFEECVDKLDAFLKGEARTGLSSGEALGDERQKVAFIFSGHGAQWLGMGRKLMDEEPVFRQVIEDCDRSMAHYTDWSLIEEMRADETGSNLHRNDVIQPMLFAVQVGLASLWRSWGVKADAVLGHSMGEVGAAYFAGALSLDDAARIICTRSKFLEQLRGQGAMVLVELSLDQARQALIGYEETVSVAVSNSPTSTVISGDPQALKEIVGALEQKDILCRWIKADAAGHSPQVEPICPALVSALDGLQPVAEQITFYSAVTAEVVSGTGLDAQYWADNMRKPVLFSVAVNKMRQDGISLFVEVAAHPILQVSIKQVFQHAGEECRVITSMRRGEDESQIILGSLGALHAVAYPVAWESIYEGGSYVSLPTYAWQRERFWLENVQMPAVDQMPGRSSRALRPSAHPLLDIHIESPATQGAHIWETGLSVSRVPEVNDHRIHNRAVLPATSYLDMVQGAVREAFPDKGYILENIEFNVALLIPDEGTRKVQLVISPCLPGTFSFEFYSRQEEAGQNEGWTLNAGGTILLTDAGSSGSDTACLLGDQVLRDVETDGGNFEDAQLSLKGVSQVWRRDGEAIAQIDVAEATGSRANLYAVDSSILGACLRVAMAAFPRSDERFKGFAFMPVGLRRLAAVETTSNDLQIYAVIDTESVGTGEVFECDVFLLGQDGNALARIEGLRWKRVRLDNADGVEDGLDDWLYKLRWEVSPVVEQKKPVEAGKGGAWLIFTDEQGVGQGLAKLLEQSGRAAILVSRGLTYEAQGPFSYRANPSVFEHFERLLKDVCQTGQQDLRGVVHLWSLDAKHPEGTAIDYLNEAHEISCSSVIHLVQAMARAGMNQSPRLGLVTCGAQAVCDNADLIYVTQSALWGVGRVIAREHPEFHCKRIDLDPNELGQSAGLLFEELWVEDSEDEIALREGARYVSRLVRSGQANEPEKSLSQAFDSVMLDGDRSVRLSIDGSGIVDHLVLREVPRRLPGPGQVEIEVYATGLNFRDVAVSVALLPPEQGEGLGFECAGRVTSIGEGVSGINIGDEVIALSHSSFATFITADARLILPKPEGVSFEQAATIPFSFLTAYYSLCEMGRMRKGDSVLIHCASGGVGLAAIQLARRLGARIFATAGSQEKRDYLKSLGVEHVMDSRSYAFADEIMQLTAGEGVDLVLNSLAGEFRTRSMSLLKRGGRFLEIGKADILQNSRLDLGLLNGNRSLFAIDLNSLIREEPIACRAMLMGVLEAILEGSLSPLPVQIIPASEVAEAFDLMAKAQHIGKIAISWRDQEVLVEVCEQTQTTFDSNSTFLVTGGLGGLGLTVARWMVEKGARHLALTGRSGASAEAQDVLREMKNMGAEIAVIQADVSDRQQVSVLLEQIEQTMPPLSGIVHAAATFDGGVLLQLDTSRFRSVLAPKVGGAWNLHALTLDKPLKFFALFSSAASLIGPPAEAGYVAANAFLDAFAHYRRAEGLPCVSINWGAWSDAGRALVDPERKEQLAAQGLGSITQAEGLDALGRILQQQHAQIAVMRFNAQRWCDYFARSAGEPMLSHLVAREKKTGAGTDQMSIRDLLLSDQQGQQRSVVLECFIKEQLAQVLKVSPSRIDSTVAFSRQGLDSLMSIELRNRLESRLELSLSATLVWKYPTINALIPHLAEKMGVTLEGNTSQDSTDDQDILMAQIKQLSESDVGALLASKLEALDEM